MKKLTLLAIILVMFAINVSAQCVGGNRYKAPVFEYDSVMNQIYGQNVTANTSIPQSLALDIYLPKNDTFQKRPVFFITHGGSFLFGTKADGDVVYLCREFAKRGYVCVSQDYRTGMEEYNAVSASRAVWRAMQDARAAIRYMKANADQYKIDTNMIIYGGSSAGGFTALHAAFLDEPQEVLPSIDTSVYMGSGSSGLGNFRGTTNNLPNSSNGIKAVVNLCGAIGDTSWIQAKDKNVVVISMHGTADRTVPYGTAIIKLLNTIPLLKVDGSSSIHKALTKKNQENYFYTYCGTDHVPYAGLTSVEKAWMDTTVRFVAKNLYEHVLKCGTAENIIVRALVDSADCPRTGIETSEAQAFKIYPNPSHNKVNIEHQFSGKTTLSIFNIRGEKVFTLNLNENQSSVELNNLAEGLYLVQLENEGKIYLQKLLVN